MKLIDKDKVVVELEKRRSRNSKNKLNLVAAFEDNYLLSFLDTLEVKEVDLEKEIDRELETRWIGEYLYTSKFRESAKHFFELGLKTQKEK